jgi:hypothetical protein
MWQMAHAKRDSEILVAVQKVDRKAWALEIVSAAVKKIVGQDLAAEAPLMSAGLDSLGEPPPPPTIIPTFKGCLITAKSWFCDETISNQSKVFEPRPPPPPHQMTPSTKKV